MFNLPAYADNITYQVDVGSFDIWKNSAGEWIKSPPYGAYKPSDSADVLPFKLQGPQGATGVKSVKFAPDEADWQKGDRGNEHKDYNKFFSNNVSNIKFKYIPATNEVELQYKVKLETLPRIDKWSDETLTTGEGIKKEWQSQTVEGYRYYVPLLIEWEIDLWWVDVITTEPDEIPEDWEIDTHLGTGKVVTNQGMANLDAAANNLTYFKNGDKVTIDYTFWNPMDDMSIAPPLKYVVMYWKHPDSWLNMPSNYEKNYIYTDYTTQDIFPRDNVGSLSYEYTVDIDSYPYELTTGRQINELTQDYPPELKAKVNPCKDDDLFMSLAVVVDPDAVLSPQSETLEPGQQTWVSLNTNIMVVHIPVEKGLDIGVELTPRQPYWQIPSDLGYVHPIIDINFSVNIDDHEWLIIADGYKEVVGITKESLQMVKTSGKPPLQDSISFKVTEPGKYTIRAGIPTEDENGTPILFDIDGELQPDINPANNHDEIVIEVSIGPPSQIKTDPDIDTGYDGGDHIRGDITG